MGLFGGSALKNGAKNGTLFIYLFILGESLRCKKEKKPGRGCVYIHDLFILKHTRKPLRGIRCWMAQHAAVNITTGSTWRWHLWLWCTWQKPLWRPIVLRQNTGRLHHEERSLAFVLPMVKAEFDFLFVHGALTLQWWWTVGRLGHFLWWRSDFPAKGPSQNSCTALPPGLKATSHHCLVFFLYTSCDS